MNKDEVIKVLIPKDSIGYTTKQPYYEVLKKTSKLNNGTKAFLVTGFSDIYSVEPMKLMDMFRFGVDKMLDIRGMKKHELAKKLGLDNSALSIKLNPRRGRKFNIFEISTLQKILECNIIFRDSMVLFETW